MRRRRFVQAIVGAPAATALVAQQVQVTPGKPGPAQPAPGIPLNPTQSVPPPARAAMEMTRIDISTADAVAEPEPRFFNAAQFSALEKVADSLMPKVNNRAGAEEAKAAEFLDFLISRSPEDRKQLYRAGLDGLNSHAKKQFNKPFAELDPAQVDTLLAPLREPWTFEVPSDPVARFLRSAKQDVRTATVNSRPYATSAAAGAGSRRGGFGGQYWYPLD